METSTAEPENNVQENKLTMPKNNVQENKLTMPKSSVQMENLRSHVEKDLAAISKTKAILGYDCFNEGAKEEIGLLCDLLRCIRFSETPDDFAEAFTEKMNADGNKNACKKLNFYIRNNCGRLYVR